MRVVLVAPLDPRQAPDLTGRWPPLGLGYLAAALESQAHHATIVDAYSFGLDAQSTVERCVAARPGLIGISLYSPQIWAVLELSHALKRRLPDVPLVAGGPHATAMPERTLAEMPALDYLLLGEADESLPALAGCLEAGVRPDAVQGLACREGEGRIAVDDRPPPPSPSGRPSRPWLRQRRPHSPYFSLVLGPLDSVITGRSCPWHCGFCCHMYDRWRPRDADAVVAEVADLRSRGIRAIDVQDDTFTADRQRTLAICESLAAKRLGLRLRVRARADTLDEEVLRALRRAGVHVVSIGVESGSQDMLDRMCKGISLDQAERACRLAREAGLLVTTSWVIGFPGETPDTVAETLAFIRRIRPHTAILAKLQPLPGTRVYSEAKAAGLLDGEWSVHSRPPWVRLPWLSSAADLDRVVAEAQKQAYRHGIGGLLAVAARSSPGFDWQTWRAAVVLGRSMVARR